ncbi:MAG TPA: redoxin family protein [Planctomycetota bacterium]|nr:redoxin family protein [Planctomycetota bacterium]
MSITAAASAQTLGIGDPAPRLKVAAFLQGEPVEAFEKGKPYVVELWATWCGPCVKSIPHLDDLARKYAEQGLTVIGVNVLENDPPKVKAFLERMQADMSYTVARDLLAPDDEGGRSGFMVKNWMQAADLRGIPAAFIIDRQGRVAWIGHPMELDEPLAQVVAGTWDIEFELKKQEVTGRLQAALQKRDFAAALAIVDELIALDESHVADFAPLRFDLMLRGKDLDAAYAYARELRKGVFADDARSLGHLAWMIVDPQRKDLARRDLDLAQELAERADGLAEGKEAALKDTLARVQFHRGDLERAIQIQNQAIELADDPRTKAQLTSTLAEYQAAKKLTG